MLLKFSKRRAAIALVLEVQHEGIPEKLSHQYGVCFPSGAEMEVGCGFSRDGVEGIYNVQFSNIK